MTLILLMTSYPECQGPHLGALVQAIAAKHDNVKSVINNLQVKP
jgi:hypothetical protein